MTYEHIVGLFLNTKSIVCEEYHCEIYRLCLLLTHLKPNLKMANCAVCNKAISIKQLKVSCCDCSKDSHGTCVKMSRADLDYLTSEGSVWRCEPCSVTRRSSLKLDSKASEGNLSLQDVITAINELSHEHKQSNIDFNKSYEVLNDKLDENTKILKEQSDQVKEYLDIIESLRIENKVLKEKVELLESKMDEAEQYSRRNTIEIQGVPHDNNNVLSTVKDVGKALDMEISESMIDICHSLRKRPDSDEPAGIIVKFVRRFDAEQLLAKKRGKKDFSTRHLNLPTDNPIYINESLSPTRRKLLAIARQTRRTQNYKWLWVKGGRIFMRKEDNGPVKVIKCQADLNNL